MTGLRARGLAWGLKSMDNVSQPADLFLNKSNVWEDEEGFDARLLHDSLQHQHWATVSS